MKLLTIPRQTDLLGDLLERFATAVREDLEDPIKAKFWERQQPELVKKLRSEA